MFHIILWSDIRIECDRPIRNIKQLRKYPIGFSIRLDSVSTQIICHLTHNVLKCGVIYYDSPTWFSACDFDLAIRRDMEKILVRW